MQAGELIKGVATAGLQAAVVFLLSVGDSVWDFPRWRLKQVEEIAKRIFITC